MRFTFLAVAACLASAMRPELSKIQSGVGSKIARLTDILSKVTKTHDVATLATLKETTDAVSGILAEMGQPYRGAVEHMSLENRTTLKELEVAFREIIFGCMNETHDADVRSLDAAIDVIERCNVNIAFRQSPQGDLGKLEVSVSLKQIELNRLQEVVDVKTEINNTKWEEFERHMQLIATPPACPGLPARTMPALDVYFEESLYVIWFAAQQSQYVVVRDAWVFANANLESAIEAYEIQLAVRNQQYCDWRTELEAACAAFNDCYSDTTAKYNTLVQEVTKQMDLRIRIKKSGDIIVSQLLFLLGEIEHQEPPPEDTADLQIVFPAIPEQGVCDLTLLEADRWVPTPSCFDVPHFQSRPTARGLGSCANYRDVLPGDPIRRGSHTVVMALTWASTRSIPAGRQWIFNIGQRTTRANHWLISGTNDRIQFGAWNGVQIRSGAVFPASSLVTTYDGDTQLYSLYIDGAFSSSITVPLDIQNGDLCVGQCGIQLDLNGCVRGVDIYRSALTAQQVQQAVSQLEDIV